VLVSNLENSLPESIDTLFTCAPYCANNCIEGKATAATVTWRKGLVYMSLWGPKEVDREVPVCGEQDIGVGESFDDLARSIAGGTMPRRRALRLFGGALFGGLVASIPGVALAQQGGNNACVRFCTQEFPPGPERARCIRQGARGEGPCHRFGCCLCSDPTFPEFGALACSPNVTSQQQCCEESCAAHPSAFRQCDFVSGPRPFTCAGPPGSECSVIAS
jgi:hypothetical protein